MSGPAVHSFGADFPGVHVSLLLCYLKHKTSWFPDFLTSKQAPKVGVVTPQGRLLWHESTKRLCMVLKEMQKSLPLQCITENHYANKNVCLKTFVELVFWCVLWVTGMRGQYVEWCGTHSLPPALKLAQALSVVRLVRTDCRWQESSWNKVGQKG